MVDDFISHGSRCFYGVRSIHRDVRAMLIYVHFDLSYTLTLLLNRPTYRVTNLMQQKEDILRETEFISYQIRLMFKSLLEYSVK